MGIRLKTPSTTFIAIRFCKIDIGINFDKRLKRRARIKFAAGPLAPTKEMSLFGLFRLQ